MEKLRELLEEFRTVVAGRSSLVDSILPPVIFVAVNGWLGFNYAMWSALIVALVFTMLRLAKGESLLFVLAGIIGVLIAILLVWLIGREEGFFLPGIFTGAAIVTVAVGSNLAGRPMVAWTSFLARRWPWDWYWHPRVRPAYRDVTWFWAIYFAGRLIVQAYLFQNAGAGDLAVLNLVAGWPSTIALLALSYLYGSWRLRNLGGPSVAEFKAGADPPWEGQRRGF